MGGKAFRGARLHREHALALFLTVVFLYVHYCIYGKQYSYQVVVAGGGEYEGGPADPTGDFKTGSRAGVQ